MRFEGKVVAVTGASRGIGREIALQFGLEGAQVACLATRVENAAPTAEAIGPKARAFGCDVSDSGQVDAAFAQIETEMGPVQILVNNAGVTRDTLLMRMSEEDFDKVLDVNLKGAWRCVKAVMRPMMKARWGRIINVSSIVGLSGAAGQANYAASKAGLIGLTLSVAKEVGSRGITCNAVAPGFIETEMTAELAEEFRNKVVETAPLGRLGTGADVAGAVLFLASDAAGYMTGQTLVIDGGLTL
ncbi:MAG: 3-oxoacyl-[acyl-carrier-protein] reductase [Fimbriimonadaceae bacterium]|nr:3-oxoacyl-[acyl-carrier-protein] reductase [Fimbriimonadaceae bacterium]QYK58343.1 MAG: 3-oxoacyl-[acyl-carrier-protein] reductase [Fimbriimonadaceae bacterium]